MGLITLAETKMFLGISGTDHDVALTAILPYVDAKVKAITGRKWSDRVELMITDTESDAFVVGDGDFIEVGSRITGSGIPDGTHIEDKYTGTKTILILSQPATDTDTITAEIGLNIGYLPLVAKLAWWMTGEQSTDLPAGSVASESIGDISVSYSGTGAELDGRHGVPSAFVQGLPRYARGY